MQPSAYTSAGSSESRPSACSGDQNSGVPSSAPGAVSEPAACHARKPEVGCDDAAAFPLDEDVRRRQVTVNDAFPCAYASASATGRTYAGGIRGSERQSLARRRGEVAAVDVLHDEERLPVARCEVEDADDVLVRQARQRARLALKTARIVSVGRYG
jgi:hypothetical protein